MAFNTIEYLKEGKVDFVYSLTTYDEQHLIEWVRKDPDRLNVINGFLDKLKNDKIRFCLSIIYDVEEYKEDALALLEKRGYIFLNSERLKNVLYNTSWGRTFIKNNLDELISYDDNTIYVILDYIFEDFKNNKDLVDLFYLHKNLHIRYLFMKYLVEKHSDLINEVYDDITKYLTSYTHQEFEQLTFLPELMHDKDICELAVTCLKSNNKELWLELKEYILKNYEENSLSGLMLHSNYGKTRALLESEFLADSDRLFETSIDPFYLYRNYSKNISKELIEDFYKRIKYFESKGKLSDNSKLSSIYYYGLGKKLERYVDEYLSLSEDRSYEYIRSGSMSACYRIGDYAFKLCQQKWSYEDVICPNLYLILRNLEEDFVRDKNGIVIAGIEVQKYLSKSAEWVPSIYFNEFKKELDRLGYFYNDRMLSQLYGNNCMILDSYKDADHPNPELLPEWFKEIPLVLVDRDRIYEKGNSFIKQLRDGY